MNPVLYINLEKGWITDPERGLMGKEGRAAQPAKASGGKTLAGVKSPAAGGGGGAEAATTADPKRQLKPGVEYEYSKEAKGEGWEATSGGGFRRPVGSGGGKNKKVEESGAETGAQDKEQKAAGTEGTSDPFSPDPKDFEQDGPEEHYGHIKTHGAAEGTDPKLTDMHRKMVQEKTKDFTSDDHQALGDSLVNNEMPDEGAKHQAVAASMGAKAQQTAPEPETPEEGAARLKAKAGKVKDAQAAEQQDKKVTSAEDKHVKSKEKHAASTKAHEESTKAHEESITSHAASKSETEKAKGAVGKAEEARNKAAGTVQATAAKLQSTEEAAKSGQEKAADKGIERASKQRQKHSNKAGSTGMNQKKAAKTHAAAEKEVGKHETTVNKHARDNLRLQDKKQSHKDAAPQHGDFQDTDKYNVAKAKHALKGKAIQAKISENKAASGKAKQNLAEAKGKVKGAKKNLSAADKTHKGAMKDFEGSKKDHDKQVKARQGMKSKDTPAVTKQREAAKAAANTLKEADKAHGDATKSHEKATKAEAGSKKKVEGAKAKADKAKDASGKAEEAVGAAEEGVGAAKDESATKAKEAQQKAVDKEEAGKAKTKGPGVLEGVRSGFHSGRAAGAAIGAAAARQEGGGAIASSVINYGTSGAVKMGHYLLNPQKAGHIGGTR